jgi:hypothetical protein
MKSWQNRILLLAGAAALAVAIPASSQESEAPESLLPPGFGDPDTLPPPVEKAAPAPPVPGAPAPPSVASGVRESAEPDEDEEEIEELDPLEQRRPVNYFSVPEGAARPVNPVGPLGPGGFGLAAGAFGRSDGVFLSRLMDRLDAPVASRWTSILLRRALLSRVPAPPRVHPVDWVAHRADLLLRMGEADAARMLVQSIDQPFYTPRLVEVAARTALATADPAALCPLVQPADSSDTVWRLADAMCAALEGEAARATALVDEARRRGDVAPIDFALTEKVIGAGAEARRSATLDWEPVIGLNAWRVGLASATGAPIPDRLLDGAAPAIRAWRARAPMVPLEQRLGAASVAASLGVFSSRSMVEIYSLMLDRTDPAETAGTVGARLRSAWTERAPAARLDAMRSLWNEAEGGHERHARLILTAGAAARIAPSEDFAADAPTLIAAMLTAGMDREAARWGAIVDESGDDAAWAMLAIAAPRPAVDLGADRVARFIEADDEDRRRSQMLVAALAGLERLDQGDAARLAGDVGLALGGEGGRWARALDRAAANRETGTVVLLAAVGMQSAGWHGVPPDHLFRIVRALRTAGLEYEARMIAAEAIARL